MRKKVSLLLAVVAFLLLGFASGASAQEGGAFGYPAGSKPPPPPPDYAYRGGEVYVSGDSVIGCNEFVEAFEDGYDEWDDQAQARRVLERCKEAGLPGLRPPAEVRQEIQRGSAREGTLPDTGGNPVLPLVVGLLLAGAALGALPGARAKDGR